MAQGGGVASRSGGLCFIEQIMLSFGGSAVLMVRSAVSFFAVVSETIVRTITLMSLLLVWPGSPLLTLLRHFEKVWDYSFRGYGTFPPARFHTIGKRSFGIGKASMAGEWTAFLGTPLRCTISCLSGCRSAVLLTQIAASPRTTKELFGRDHWQAEVRLQFCCEAMISSFDTSRKIIFSDDLIHKSCH